ncbi:MAG: FKBP-type peptidyl-prolyl cis-trans isomerase [Bacteroidota bacterium]|nr:FKBP-type peptidyl-prolyl cis-trans isomerase [Bacteroidota bacterium]
MISGKIAKLWLLAAGILIFSFSSCTKVHTRSQADEDAEIAEFLATNDTLHFQHTASGLYFLNLEVGTGLQPATHDSVFVIHTIGLLTGPIVYTNEGTTDTLEVPVNEGLLIPGFEEGLTYMKAGGKALLLVPSTLAYGSTGYLNIAGYTPLIIKIYLARVRPYPFSK